ncbi:hypothetical protein EZS27_044372, partial [termite gut metagenome]
RFSFAGENEIIDLFFQVIISSENLKNGNKN